MSKVIKLCVVLTIVLSLFDLRLPANAANYSEVDAANMYVQVESTERTLDYEEAIEVLMEKLEVSRKEADELLGGSEEINGRSSEVGTYGYKEYINTYYYAGYPVEIGGIWKVYNYGSFRQFEECSACWTGATGSGAYTWSEFYAQDITASYPTTIVNASGRGAIEVAVDISSSSGMELGSELIGLGFSKSYSVGTTTYFRYIADLNLNVSLY